MKGETPGSPGSLTKKQKSKVIMKQIISHEQAVQDRKARVIARGEHSDHSHVIVGDAKVMEEWINGRRATIVQVGSHATIRHLIESVFIQQGNEVWTGEHKDIHLQAGRRYAFVPQQQRDPLTQLVERVLD